LGVLVSLFGISAGKFNGVFPVDGGLFQIVEQSTVVTSGTNGYEIFRIPVQVRAPNGDLLLFCEARKTSDDFGDIDVFLFRSTDEGQTWSDGTLVVDNGSDTAADIAAVVEGGRIHLFYQERPADRTFNDYLFFGASDAHGFYIYSDDNAQTWSQPKEITQEVLPASDEQLPMFGPNSGIVLDSGRLVVPMYYANQTESAFVPAVIYSDDGGETWQRSQDAIPSGEVNETAVVQAPNGDVYAIARDDSDDNNDQKRFFRSVDGGKTWAETGDVDPFVPEVSNQQSMVARGGRVFVSTSQDGGRTDGRLKTGIYDTTQSDNVNWSSDELQITTDGFAYSSTVARDSTIHLVHEKQNSSGVYESLEYVQIRAPVPDLSVEGGASGDLDFTADVSPGTQNNPVGIFRLSAGQRAGAAFDSVAVTNQAPGVEGISKARLFWSSDQTLEPSSDQNLDDVLVDTTSAPSTLSFDDFGVSIPTEDRYAILAIDVQADAEGSGVQFEIAQREDLSLPGGGIKTVNGQSDTTFSSLLLSNGGTALPVDFAGLTARITNSEDVLLQWRTTREAQNAGFWVQRRIPEGGRFGGEDTGDPYETGWTDIGWVEGGGTTIEAQSYQFIDRDVPRYADSIMYRLKQMDVGRGTSYSKSVAIDRREVSHPQLLELSPNPARQVAMVSFAVPEKTTRDAALHLYDMLGRRVRTVRTGMKPGRYRVQFDTSRLSSGVYFLKLTVGGAVRTKRLTVLR
jgi:hypothetical protein